MWWTKSASPGLGSRLQVKQHFLRSDPGPVSSFCILSFRWRADEAQKLLAGGGVEAIDSPKDESAIELEKAGPRSLRPVG